EGVREALRGPGKTGRYISLEDSVPIKEAVNLLRGSPDCIEIEKKQLFRDEGREFQRDYSGFIGDLNARNSSLSWWALNFTGKSPVSTALANKVFCSLVIARLIETVKEDYLIIFTGDRELYRQAKLAFSGKRILLDLVQAGDNIGQQLLSWGPLVMCLVIAKTLLAKFFCSFCFNPVLAQDKKYLVLLSLLDQQCFLPSGRYRDVYFGEFVEYLNREKQNILSVMEVARPYFKNMKLASRLNGQYRVIPKERFIGLLDIFMAIGVYLKRFFSRPDFAGVATLRGRDMSFLVRCALADEFRKPRFFYNLLMFYSIKGLVKSVKPEKFYYPFENRPFEKMAVLALRRFSPATRIVGFQHTALTIKKNLGFYISKSERDVVPLPDTILTMGPATRKIMEESFNLPAGLIQVGCALRKSVKAGILKSRPGNVCNLLVVLSADLYEYSGVLGFLNEGLKDNLDYKLIIRPHPAVPLLEKAIVNAGKISFSYTKQDKNISLAEALKQTDVVLYASAAVAIEALSCGIPAVFLDIGDFLNNDPLFDFHDFKWEVNSPKDLISTLKSIKELTETEFRGRQAKGVEYARQYMFKVTDSRLADFLAA
ncbi:MAG: hypothetical protein NTY14_09075, partial [Candidatus Omnitrophica bacterium]|nr:hypothetical protein [Candidatus Omnitrophota bacterium]